MHSLFFFYCENNFAAPKDFYFIEYRLKWLFKCKRLPTPALIPVFIAVWFIFNLNAEKYIMFHNFWS